MRSGVIGGKEGRKEEERKRTVSDELICHACDHHFSPDTVCSLWPPTDLNISLFKS